MPVGSETTTSKTYKEIFIYVSLGGRKNICYRCCNNLDACKHIYEEILKTSLNVCGVDVTVVR